MRDMPPLRSLRTPLGANGLRWCQRSGPRPPRWLHGRDGACPFRQVDFLLVPDPDRNPAHRCDPIPPMKKNHARSHGPVHSRRTFIRNMTLGAALIGSGAARALAAEIGEAAKGGERRLGVALMGLGLYSRGQLGPAFLKTKLCRFAGVVTGSHAKGVKWSRHYDFPERNIWSYDTIHDVAGNPDIDII